MFNLYVNSIITGSYVGARESRSWLWPVWCQSSGKEHLHSLLRKWGPNCSRGSGNHGLVWPFCSSSTMVLRGRSLSLCFLIWEVWIPFCIAGSIQVHKSSPKLLEEMWKLLFLLSKLALTPSNPLWFKNQILDKEKWIRNPLIGLMVISINVNSQIGWSKVRHDLNQIVQIILVQGYEAYFL